MLEVEGRVVGRCATLCGYLLESILLYLALSKFLQQHQLGLLQSQLHLQLLNDALPLHWAALLHSTDNNITYTTRFTKDKNPFPVTKGLFRQGAIVAPRNSIREACRQVGVGAGDLTSDATSGRNAIPLTVMFRLVTRTLQELDCLELLPTRVMRSANK